MFAFRALLLLGVLGHPATSFGRSAEKSVYTDRGLGGQKGSGNEEGVNSECALCQKIAATVKSTAVTVNA